MDYFLLVVLAYLCGSIPFAKLVGNMHGIDIQKHGSGNIGFANTVRVLGWKAGFMVLPGDVLKGVIPVLIARHFLPLDQVLVVGLAAILGHIFPAGLKFRGGKGIATGLGVTLVLNPIVGGIGIVIYLLGFYWFRKSAPASVLAAWCLPLLCAVISPRFTFFYFGLAVLTIFTHRNNIRLMLAKM